MRGGRMRSYADKLKEAESVRETIGVTHTAH
jgi:hypothetical protein